MSCVLFVLAVLLAAYGDRDSRPGLYLLSFWHYYLYWLAFTVRAVDFDVFRRDAVRNGGALVVAAMLGAALISVSDVLTVAAALACAGVLYRCYTAPRQLDRSLP